MNKKLLLSLGFTSFFLLGCGNSDGNNPNIGSSVFSFLDDKKINGTGLEGVWQQAALQNDTTTSNTINRVEKLNIKNFIRIEYTNNNKTAITFSDCDNTYTFNINNNTLTETGANSNTPTYSLNIVDENDMNGTIHFSHSETNSGLTTTLTSEAEFRMVKVTDTASRAVATGSSKLNTNTTQQPIYDCYKQISAKISHTENQINHTYKSTSVKTIAQDSFTFFIEDSSEEDSYILKSDTLTPIEHSLAASSSITVGISDTGSQSTISDSVNSPDVNFDVTVNLSF